MASIDGTYALTPAGLREAAEAFDTGAARSEAKAQVRCLRPHYRRWLREQAAKDRAAAQTAREMAADLERRIAERAALERRAELERFECWQAAHVASRRVGRTGDRRAEPSCACHPQREMNAHVYGCPLYGTEGR